MSLLLNIPQKHEGWTHFVDMGIQTDKTLSGASSNLERLHSSAPAQREAQSETRGSDKNQESVEPEQ